MEIYISEQMLKYGVILIFVFWLLVYVVYNLLGWKIRKYLMRKLSRELNLVFNNKSDMAAYYTLEGMYFGKNVCIEESDYNINKIVYSDTFTRILFRILPQPVYNGYRKKIIIRVDDVVIYENRGDIFLPFPNSIKNILDRYVNEGLKQGEGIRGFLTRFLKIFLGVMLLIMLAVVYFLKN